MHQANAPSVLPNVKNKYYTRSTLVKNLIPFPSEGKVRALFGEQPNFALPRISNNQRNKTSDNGLQDGNDKNNPNSRSP